MPFDDFMTPPVWLERVRSMYRGAIDFDAASNMVAQQYVNANKFAVSQDDYNFHIIRKHLSSMDNDGAICDSLSHVWSYDNIWCNPPYSKGLIDKFTYKAICSRSNYRQLLYLVNSATDTNWYHMMLREADAMLLVKGRIKFWKIFDGKAHAEWEGEKSKKEGKGKIGNSPRYLNTLFYLGSERQRFYDYFGDTGKVILLK